MSDAILKILDWRPVRRGALRGFATIALPSGMILRDVPIFGAAAGSRAGAPAKPMIGRDGATMRDDDGKVRYSPIVEFTDRSAQDRFSRAVLDALAAAHPEALA